MPVIVVQCLNCEKRMAERWERGAKGTETNAEGEGNGTPRGREMGRGCTLTNRLGDLGSVVSSPSGVRDGAPTENEFDVFCGR